MIKKNTKKTLVVILLGPPGSGKGTQAVEIAKKLSLPHISTGDLFRENIQNNTVLGQKAKSFIDKGNLVPDELVLDMLFDRLSKNDCKKGYILDGFPRTLSQAESLEAKLKTVNYLTINLDVKDDILVDRISKRLICKNCKTPYHETNMPPKTAGICDKCGGKLYHRDDDNAEVVASRLTVYHTQSEPLIEYYKNQSHLVNVEASGNKDQILGNILQTIEKTK